MKMLLYFCLDLGIVVSYPAEVLFRLHFSKLSICHHALWLVVHLSHDYKAEM